MYISRHMTERLARNIGRKWIARARRERIAGNHAAAVDCQQIAAAYRLHRGAPCEA